MRRKSFSRISQRLNWLILTLTLILQRSYFYQIAPGINVLSLLLFTHSSIFLSLCLLLLRLRNSIPYIPFRGSNSQKKFRTIESMDERMDKFIGALIHSLVCPGFSAQSVSSPFFVPRWINWWRSRMLILSKHHQSINSRISVSQ